MINSELRSELLAMRVEDEDLHTPSSNTGALNGRYVPSSHAVHERNAARLKVILREHGWPNEDLVGPDGAYAAGLVVQHFPIAVVEAKAAYRTAGGGAIIAP